MKKVIALVALMLTSINVFAAGSIEGRVGDKGENVFLQGAIVTVVELNRQTSTGSNGAYRFGSIPAGSYTVRVDYLGAETTEMKVNVRDEQIASQDFRLSVRGDLDEEVIVYGQAAGTASALNQQRSADYVTTIVSADDIGQFPDQNVAEALQRLPGIFVERDQGEGRFIGIRGISPNLNNTKINGLNVPAPESDRRSVALDVIPSELLEGLEVAKTFTPDMDGDGIGGHIDIKSLSAFDRDGAFLNIGAETSYTDLDEEHSPKVNIAGGNVFSIGDGTDNLGVAATISWQERDFGSDNVETDGGWDFLETEAGDEFLGAEEIEMRDYVVTRERLGFTLNLDYKASENTTLFFRSLYSEFSDQEYRNRNQFKFDDGDAVAGTDSSATWEGATLEKDMKDRYEEQQILSLQVGGTTYWDAWTFDYLLGRSESEESEPDRLDTTFVLEGIDMGYTSVGERPGLFADSIGLDAGNFEMDEIVYEDNLTEDEETVFKMDFTRDLTDMGYNGDVKFGFKVRRREKTNDLTAIVYDGFPGDPTLTGFTDVIDYSFYDFGPAMNAGALSSFFYANRNELEIDDDDTLVDSTAGDFSIDEDVDAFYLMSKFVSGRHQIVYGVRYEDTDFSATGQRIVIDDIAGSGDPVAVATDFDNSYDHLLPSINWRMRLTEEIVLRAAYTQTISRPTFGQVSPGGEIELEEDDGEFELGAEIGNPNLEAIEADNFDFSIEYYPGGIGVLSAAVFHKSLENPIIVIDNADNIDLTEFAGNIPLDDAEVIQPINGDDADLTGVELAWTWTAEEGPAAGLILGLNATFTDGEASLPERDIDLPGLSDTVWNASIGYENQRLSLRLAATYKSENLLEVLDTGDPLFDRYQDDHMQVDFTARYRFTDAFQVYFNAINMTDEPFYAYFDRTAYNSQYDEFGRTYILGVRYNMQ